MMDAPSASSAPGADGARSSRPRGAGRIEILVVAAATVAVALLVRVSREPASAASGIAPAGPHVTDSPTRTQTPGLTAEEAAVGMTPGEAGAVNRFLSAHAELRLARDEDSRPSDDADDIARLYGVYHPYFVRGDLDDDGRLDFVVAFVSRTSPPSTLWFSVAVFRGTEGGGFDEPFLIEREISLQDGDLSVDRDCLVVTPDLAEDAARRYRWNVSRRQFEFVGEGDAAPDAKPASRV
jgi:hypothetical protein